MHRRQQADCSSDDSNGSDIESCFDTEDEESDPDTNPTDVDTDVEGDSGADISWLLDENKDHPPEYYLNQEDEFDESEYMDEDYSDNSCLLLDFIEERFFQYCKYTRKDPEWTMRDISLRVINAFFDWLLNQRRGKGGRRVRGVRSANTLGTYWKVFRLVHERATGEKIRGEINRKIHRILRKLVKKHKLTKGKREKTAMYVEDLVEYLQTNLTTTKKRYTHGRHPLLNLRYRDIVVTLLRDPNSGPHRILIEFTCEFTKQFLGVKYANKFPLPEIIFDPSLILSPHVFLLGLIFADRAFAAPNLTSAGQLSGLDIRPGYQQLELLLRPSMLDVPVFRKSVRTGYGYEISPHEPLSYATLLSLMKAVGVIAGFLQPTRPYCLRYGAGNEFNQSGDVSDALQNMMLQHANIDTFIKHYLPRRVTADVRAIVSGYEPQKDLMRAACRMTRWIDPNRPQNLTREQSQSVDKHRRLCQLLAQRARWDRHFKGAATKQPGYGSLSSDIVNLRLRLRAALLKKLRDQWDVENPVNEVELQLSGLKFSDDPGTKFMTMPGTTVEEEFRRRNAAIDAVAAYCYFQEGGAVAMPRGRPPTQAKGACPQLMAADAEKQALSAAMLLVFTEKRPTICFVCLGEASLPFEKRVYSFASPGDLTKHFKRKHLSNIRRGDRIGCKVCRMSLEHKMHLQNHAARIHGTVS
ncbi:MAG: hypothetical protein M1839_002973 [Geoglossum umbratile]|nr:MAG: hypothetical protein M1839_002973 [Geoglossum umbratile]